MKKLIAAVGLAWALSACTYLKTLSPADLAALHSPPPDVIAKVDNLSAKALAFMEQVETTYWRRGRPLSEAELRFARSIGIKNTSGIRIVVLEDLPMPDDPDLRKAAQSYGMGSWLEGARTLGSVIFLKPRYASSDEVVSHELVHVAQFERLGRERMIRRYILELELVGHLRSPLENEAYGQQRAKL